MNMVERVAKALYKAYAIEIGYSPEAAEQEAEGMWSEWVSEARATIAAMREPTEEMLANHAGKNYSFLLGGEGQYVSDEDVILNWQELIDAALTSSEK